MKNKVIFIGIICFVLILSISYILIKKGNSVINVSSLCGEKYSEDCSAINVLKCKDSSENVIYNVEFGCTDIPNNYYYSNLSFAASCGGMPLPDGGSYKTSELCNQISDCYKVKSCVLKP